MTSQEQNPMSNVDRLELEFNHSVGNVVSQLRTKRIYRSMVGDFFANAQTGNVVFFFGNQAQIYTSFFGGIPVETLVDSMRLILLTKRVYKAKFSQDQDHVIAKETERQVSIVVKDNFYNPAIFSQRMTANFIFISSLSLSFLHDAQTSRIDLQKSSVDRVNNALQVTQQYLHRAEVHDRANLLGGLRYADERTLRDIANQLVSLNLN